MLRPAFVYHLLSIGMRDAVAWSSRACAVISVVVHAAGLMDSWSLKVTRPIHPCLPVVSSHMIGGSWRGLFRDWLAASGTGHRVTARVVYLPRTRAPGESPKAFRAWDRGKEGLHRRAREDRGRLQYFRSCQSDFLTFWLGFNMHPSRDPVYHD